jgi:hypothetical protein
MLGLLTPRIIARSAGRYRELELDDDTFDRSRKVLIESLQGGRALTRNACFQVLETAHISAAGQRGIHILAHLAQQGVLCLGPRSGKQFTFVMLDDWVPHSRHLEREEALCELAERYFTSHGPATLQDFAWWSGLTTTETRFALEQIRNHLSRETIDDTDYWFSPSTPALSEPLPSALLPPYDEIAVAYKDRRAVLDPSLAANTGNGIFRPTVVLDGRMAGTWKRTRKTNYVAVTITLFTAPEPSGRETFDGAVNRYGAFLDKPVHHQIVLS